VRALLDRKDRIGDIKTKTEGKMKKNSFYSMSSSLRSPSKKRDL